MIKKIKNWDWLRFLALIIPYLVIVGVFQVIGFAIAGVSFDEVDIVKTTSQHTIITFFILLGTLLTLFIFMKWVDKEPFVKLGLSLKNRLPDFFYGIFAGALIMLMGLFILLGLNQIYFEEIIIDWKSIILVSLTFIFVSISEELLIRGYVLKNFMESFNKYVALILSSVIFSLMHLGNDFMSWITFIDLVLAGILLGLSYTYTKNLWFPIGLHFSWNFFQSLFGFNVSGQDEYSIIELSKTENNFLNGGDFGFEGSVFALVFQTILIVIIVLFYERKNPRIVNSS